MAILGECPICHTKQAVKNKKCSCGGDLEKARKSRRVRYWIKFRMPDGSQHTQAVGGFEGLDPYSIEDARDAESKRKVQRREKKIFEILPEATMPFSELTKWYLDLESVKDKRYFWELKIKCEKFNSVFGNLLVRDVKYSDLTNHQARRKKEGLADSTIDQEIGAIKTVIRAAFMDKKVDGDTLRTFQNVKKLLKRNANARKMILSPDQFKGLMEHLPLHSRQMLATGFYTGMRKGEILKLTWDKVSLKDRTIRLEAADTKDKEPRVIPICSELQAIMEKIPRNIHDNHVFLYCGRPVEDIRAGLKNACEKAKIPYGRFVKDGFIFHDLRHSFNTYMRKAGVQESVIMEITGHSTREMFDRYNTIDEEDKKQAVSRFEGFLRMQPGQESPSQAQGL